MMTLSIICISIFNLNRLYSGISYFFLLFFFKFFLSIFWGSFGLKCIISLLISCSIFWSRWENQTKCWILHEEENGNEFKMGRAFTFPLWRDETSVYYQYESLRERQIFHYYRLYTLNCHILSIISFKSKGFVPTFKIFVFNSTQWTF